jgi:hypothetical protein
LLAGEVAGAFAVVATGVGAFDTGAVAGALAGDFEGVAFFGALDGVEVFAAGGAAAGFAAGAFA